jgi:oligopeptide/dipeptide ABC transporter ATP-binding protein
VIPAPLLRVENLVKHFPSRHGTVKAINDVSFEVARGEALGLVGESGSGKTTVGRCLLGLIRAGSGRVVFEGRDLATVSAREMRRLRARIQFVFQDPTDALNPRMRIGDLVADPMRRAGRMDSSSSMKRAAELLDLVGLGAGCATRYPHEFSTGEQQRIGIARAIATKPDLVVLDEPTSALDVSVRAEILNLLQELQTELGITYLFISHDLTAVRRVCQRIAIMYLGRIVEIGATEEIFADPLHPYARALLSSIMYPDPRQKRSDFQLSGEIPSPIHLPSGCPLHTRCPMAIEECRHVVPAFEDKRPGRRLSCLRVEARA